MMALCGSHSAGSTNGEDNVALYISDAIFSENASPCGKVLPKFLIMDAKIIKKKITAYLLSYIF